jgi:hypothetical protein
MEMKLGSISKLMRLVICASAAFAFALLVPQSGSAQTDPLIGTWKLNVAKSTFNPGPPLRSATAVIAAAGQGLTITFEAIDPQGMPIRAVYPLMCDGQAHPITGDPGFDANSCRRPDPYTTEFIGMKSGMEKGRGTVVVSRDGRTHTLNIQGTNSGGQSVNDSLVYDKQ